MRLNDFKIDEDAKMAKATDEKIIALLMQFSKMDLSSPANEFMFKRVRKEFKKRNISLSPEQMKSFIGAQRSIDKVKIGEDEGDMGDDTINESPRDLKPGDSVMTKDRGMLKIKYIYTKEKDRYDALVLFDPQNYKPKVRGGDFQFHTYMLGDPGSDSEYNKQDDSDLLDPKIVAMFRGPTMTSGGAGKAVKQLYAKVYRYVDKYDDAALEYLDDNAPMFTQMFQKYQDIDSLVKALDDDTLEKLAGELESVADELKGGVLESSDEDFRDGHDINLLKAVAKQFAEDLGNSDYTAIDELLKNVPESDMRAYLPLGRSEMESVQEDMDPKGPEVTIGDYTTKNFYMCGGAIDTAEKFPDNEGMEKLIRLQDLMFGLEADVMNGMEATDEVIEFGTELTDAIMDQAKVAGIEKEVEEYQPMHLAAIKTGDPEPGYGRVDTEEED